MRLAMTIALGLALTGCEGSFKLLGGQPPIIVPPGDKVVEAQGETVIEPSPPQVLCQARARHFRGTVSIPCEDIARQIAP